MVEIKEGTGTIDEKSEAVTKKKDKYWKFKIDGLSYSMFEHEAGTNVGVGDKVKMYWTEKPGVNPNSGDPIVYRNLTSIGKEENYEEKTPEQLIKVENEVKSQSSYTPTLDTNTSIVRQVLYKVAGEILVKGTPSEEVNKYVKELEKGFYER